MSENSKALLVAADGIAVRGEGRGAPGVAVGELVFQTGMVGYQEALTDPSYAGQLLIFTYPLVGNYGAGSGFAQSGRVHTRGVVLSELMLSGGHRDTHGELDSLLHEQGIPAIAGVDTRSLVRKVRRYGVLPAAIAVAPEEELPPEAELLLLARSLDYDSTDFVAECSTPKVVWHPSAAPEGKRVALLDYGTKQGIVDGLLEAGAGVWLVPATATAEEVLALQPDGIVLSNGPGDPAHLGRSIRTVRELVERTHLPIFGICLGHQLLALAAGGRTSKMRFGHRGINQPVLELDTGRVSITTQNHGYMVDSGTLPTEYRLSHTNLNDGTVEGFEHTARPVWGVQWHPEAHPGPTDTRPMFWKFMSAVEGMKRET
jgi:carbamoyl-phosphate synthase small subunit